MIHASAYGLMGPVGSDEGAPFRWDERAGCWVDTSDPIESAKPTARCAQCGSAWSAPTVERVRALLAAHLPVCVARPVREPQV